MGVPPGLVPRSGPGVQDLHEWAVMSVPDSSGPEVADSFVTGTERGNPQPLILDRWLGLDGTRR
jgi:hypothetical protein